MNLIYGILWGILGQICSFLQLQAGIKFGWFEKVPIILLLSSIPTTLIYLKSVRYIMAHFDGQIWPGRLIGFGVGIIVFTLLSSLLFKENISLKTIITLMMAASILGVQIFWK